MENAYTFGNDNYPTSVTTTYNFLIKWKRTPELGPTNPSHSDGMTLTTKTTDGTVNPIKYKIHIKLFG